MRAAGDLTSQRQSILAQFVHVIGSDFISSEAWIPDPALRFAAFRAENDGVARMTPIIVNNCGWHKHLKKSVILGPKRSEAKCRVGNPGLGVGEARADGIYPPLSHVN